MQHTIETGTKMCFGVPAVPMPEARRKAIAKAVARVSGVREAFLPQCLIEGDDESRQVLMIGIDEGANADTVMGNLARAIGGIFPPDQFIDIFPYPMDSPMEVARIEECRIYGADQKPWWQLW